MAMQDNFQKYNQQMKTPLEQPKEFSRSPSSGKSVSPEDFKKKVRLYNQTNANTEHIDARYQKTHEEVGNRMNFASELRDKVHTHLQTTSKNPQMALNGLNSSLTNSFFGARVASGDLGQVHSSMISAQSNIDDPKISLQQSKAEFGRVTKLQDAMFGKEKAALSATADYVDLVRKEYKLAFGQEAEAYKSKFTHQQ